MKNIYFFSNIASHYRKWIWLKLLEMEKVNIYFYYGGSGKTGIKEIEFSHTDFLPHVNKMHKVKNLWIMKKTVIWQLGVISLCINRKMDIAVFTGEMYCISTWIASIICRIRKITVVFWGHGIYGDEGKLKLFLRKCFYRLADKHLLYDLRGKQEMIHNGFKTDNLYVVFNSLDYERQKSLCLKFQTLSKTEIYSFFTNPRLPVIVFIGRLTSEKKINLLISAAEQLNKREVHANLLIIGDGKEKERLFNQAEVGIKHGWLYFTGALYDEEIIGKHLYCSDLCVSPGNVGLTAIHSLSYGTPVSTHSNLNNQGPEVSSVIEGYNGFLFEENNVFDLKEKISGWLLKNQDREAIRKQCYEIIDKYYNPNYQISIFKKLIFNLKSEI